MRWTQVGKVSWAALTAWMVATAAIAVGWGDAPAAATPSQTPTPEAEGLVTGAALPTVQIDGVVWDTEIVGDTVYAVGSFSNARPAGAAPGTQQTSRSNILAFDLQTGELLADWDPSLNAEARTIVASEDGSRLIVGGHFTRANGQIRNRVVALDSVTGDVIADWNPNMSGGVLTAAVSGDTVYLGGTFTSVSGRQRLRLAAVSVTSGDLLPWAPSADLHVEGIAVHEASSRVVAVGRFGELNGIERRGSGSIDGATGEVMPWAAKDIIPNGGTVDLGISSVTIVGDLAYGTGWHYVDLPLGSIEGTFAVDVVTGEIEWMNACFGDTYDVAVLADVAYSVGHEHDCGPIGSHFETSSRSFQHARAFDARGSSTGRTNADGPFHRWFQQAGQPASEALAWTPRFGIGSYTGQHQAGWTVEASDGVLVIGGEFPSVNDEPQQGLVRFATPEAGGPDTQGPTGYSELQPSFTTLDDGRVRVEWTAAWDVDDSVLTYELLRGPQIHNSEVIGTLSVSSDRWQRRPLATQLIDPPPGSHKYRVRALDAAGNALVSRGVDYTSPSGSADPSAYHDRVVRAGAIHQWRLGERSGLARDWIGSNDMQIWSSAQRGQSGAIVGDGDDATRWASNSSSNTVRASSTYREVAPDTFSIEAWFRTDTNRGGKLVGFGDSRTRASESDRVDRHIYMTNDGRVVFGVRPDFGQRSTIESSRGWNDNRWHHVVATLGPDGAVLYLDGQEVASDSTLTQAQVNAGYWRLAGDNLSSWPRNPDREAWIGSLDEVAVYHRALPAVDVAENYSIGLGNEPTPEPEPEPDPVFAVDSFERELASGWGSAEVGGAWSRLVSADHVVDGGRGRVELGSAGAGRSATLTTVSQADVDVSVDVSIDTAPTGSGVYIGVVGRSVSPGNDYLAKVRLLRSGAVHLSIVRRVGYSETTMASEVVDGLTYRVGHEIRAALQVEGDQLRASVWPSEQERPAEWQLTASDSTPELQAPGAVGTWSYVGGTATAVPVGVTFDDFHATAVGHHLPVPPTEVPEPGPVFAQDDFERELSAGWGAADAGGAWSRMVPGDASVEDGAGQLVLPTAGAGRSAALAVVDVADSVVSAEISLHTEPTGSGVYAAVVGREVSPGSSYLAKVRFLAGGAVHVSIVARVSYAETVLATSVVPGVEYALGDRLHVELTMSGDAISVAVWPADTEPPAQPLLSVVDTTPQLQGSGAVGVWAYVGASATTPPVTVRFDNFAATEVAPEG